MWLATALSQVRWDCRASSGSARPSGFEGHLDTVHSALLCPDTASMSTLEHLEGASRQLQPMQAVTQSRSATQRVVSAALFHPAAAQAAHLVVQGEWMSARCINLLLMYLTHAVALSATWKVMKPHIHQLVVSCIFPMTCFDDEDQMLWGEDPHEYIRKVSTAP